MEFDCLGLRVCRNALHVVRLRKPSIGDYIRRRKFNHSSRSKSPRLRYAAIEPQLCYDRAALNFTACCDGDCSAGLAPRTVPVSASKFCYNAPRKRPRRFDIVCRVGVRATLWHRELIIACRANGYGADLDAMFAAR